MLKEQLFMSKTFPSIEEFRPIENRHFVKPKGGLWTSTYLNEFGSSWVQFCLSGYQIAISNKKPFLLTPSKDTRIYVVNSYNDLVYLMENYKQCHPSSDSYQQPTTHFIDFEEISLDYDAIHLTDEGQWETRLSQPHNLYGWDVECTLWLNWSFDYVKMLENGEFLELVDAFE